MRTFLIILLGTLSLLLPRSGWSHDLYFRHYTNKQGLSHNTVYCALQDKKGFMWFGTDDGLNRFDDISSGYTATTRTSRKVCRTTGSSAFSKIRPVGYGSAPIPTPAITTIKQMLSIP